LGDLYQENKFYRIEPVVLAIREEGTPQHWVDTYRKLPPDKHFEGLVHDFGLKDGWTCLTNGLFMAVQQTKFWWDPFQPPDISHRSLAQT
jgi:hypothetical protein